MQCFSAYFLNDHRKWFSLQYNTCDEKQQQHIRFKNANLKKYTVSSIYPRFLTYRSHLSVTEKSNTYDISFPQASFSKNNSVSLNQLKGSKPIKSAVHGWFKHNDIFKNKCMLFASDRSFKFGIDRPPCIVCRIIVSLFSSPEPKAHWWAYRIGRSP